MQTFTFELELKDENCYAYICIGHIFLFFYLFLTRTRDEPQCKVKVGATPPSLTLDSDILGVIGAQPSYTSLASLLTYSPVSLLISLVLAQAPRIYLAMLTHSGLVPCIYTVPVAEAEPSVRP